MKTSPRFLDKSVKIPQIAFASFPRSGNTMVRRHLEEITSIITGDHVKKDFTCDISLSVLGLAGQGVLDDSVWIVKTHSPIDNGKTIDFEATKTICCVRNPYDAILSQFNFNCTWTHSKKVSFELNQENL